MLSHLHIKNYALIDRLDLQWHEGLSAITGETGAGKSILLGALGLALGERADRSALFNQQEKCVIEVEFDLSQRNLKPLFEDLELDYADRTIIRRELTPSGKSRSFVNDTPVVLQSLKRIGAQLIDIHGQHDTLNLQRSLYQLSIIDDYAGHADLLHQMKVDFTAFQQLDLELKRAEEDLANNIKERDYLQFIWEELDQARLEDINLEDLKTELLRLENADQIKGNLYGVNEGLNESDHAVVSELRRLSDLLGELRSYDQRFDELYKRLESARIELDDIASEVSHEADSVESDPQRRILLEEQMDELNRLMHKHQLNEVEELIHLKKELDEKLRHSDDLDDRIASLREGLKVAEAKMHRTKNELTASRMKAAKAMSTEVLEQIHYLSMPAASFEIRVEETAVSAQGGDRVRFMFTANPGVPLQEMERAASGGELSRIMLGIKKVLSSRTTLPTIIFDEIDTGVSGETVSRMAEMLMEMSAKMQVIAVTHLAQMAAKGTDHLVVRKSLINKEMKTSITRLQAEERIEEIARLLSGEEVTDTSRNHAKELMAG